MYRISFIIFWISAFLLMSARCVFDIKTYLYGSTISHQTVFPGEYQYLLHLPPGYTDFENPRPLIIYLHGAGETNIGLDRLQQCDLWHYAKGHIPADEFPFIVVSFMALRHGWEPKSVIRTLDGLMSDSTKRFRIDPNRVYLSGVSMGGFGTFRIASEYPECFAAIIPVCGGVEPEKADRLLDMPIWAFHGDADDVVSHECSSKVIDAIHDLGGKKAELTTYHGAGHGIVQDVYCRRDLFQWLIQQKNMKK